jgi:hypothetical protein
MTHASETPKNFARAWRRLRLARRTYWLAMMLFVVGVSVGKMILGNAVGFLLAPLFGVIAFSLWCSLWFTCPRCGQQFATRGLPMTLRPMFETECVHCGLRLGAPDGETVSDAPARLG